MCTLNCTDDSFLFSNAFSFLRLPLELNPYDGCHRINDGNCWVITGVPFDMATSGRSGSRFGPGAIRQASMNLAWECPRWPWNFDIHKRLRIIDCGDLIFQTGNVKNFTSLLQNHAEKLLLSGKKMLSFGGDHYITLPILRAYAKIFGKISIVHFDAHVDYYGYDNKYDHGSFILHAINEKLINPMNSVQIGIRTKYEELFGFKVLNAEYVNSTDIKIIVEQVISAVGSDLVYLTFDIDCLDPSAAPGTGTPVIGGLTSMCALKLIRGLQKLNVIGMDLVEVSSAYDYSDITALAAATLSLEMLYVQANKIS